MISMDTIRLIIDDLKWCGTDIQKFINCRYKNYNTSIIDNRFFNPDCISTITTKEGFQFNASPNIRSWFDVKDCYKFDDITKNDTVLDIGGNIGCFCLPASLLAKKVYSVEPLLADELRYNILRNKIQTAVVIESALGDGNETEVSWCEDKRNIKSKTLLQLIADCGGHVDFLKCDCEGGEWYINPEDIAGIRRIEMELHYFRGMKTNPALIDYIKEHYDTTINDTEYPAAKILHATLKER